MNPEELKEKVESAQIPIEELKQRLFALEKGAFVTMNDDELRTEIKEIHTGFVLSVPILPAGTPIFRAVKVTQRPKYRSRIGYPPTEAVRSQGRCNRAGGVIFYGSLEQFATCLQESSCQIGDFFAVSVWLTTESMAFHHLGYSAAILKKLGTIREMPWFSNQNVDSERSSLIREWQSKVFMQQVPEGREYLYRLPIALAETAIWPIGQPNPKKLKALSGLIYPSVASSALGDNIAIIPSEVDTKMALVEVNLLTLDSSRIIQSDGLNTAAEIRIIAYECARPGEDGTLVWEQESQVLRKGDRGWRSSDLRVLAPGAPLPNEAQG